jgi:prefoldin subunit 5
MCPERRQLKTETSDNPLAQSSVAEPEESLSDSLQKLESRLTRLNQRIQRIEDAVTDESFHWQKRFNESE